MSSTSTGNMKLVSHQSSNKHPGLFDCVFRDTGDKIFYFNQWCDSRYKTKNPRYTLTFGELTVYCTDDQLTYIVLTFC